MNNEEITPIEEVKEEKNTEILVEKLPDWDLLPPFDVIRRVNRK